MMHIWPGKAFELWATFRPFKEEEETKIVALFLSEESAAAYLASSRFKTVSKKKRFRKTSLLHGASEAWIEEAEELPIEPSL